MKYLKEFLILSMMTVISFAQKPSVENCGVGNAPMRRIFNGQEVDPPHKYPWLAAMYLDNFTLFRCQGAIITEKNIITSGQCMDM
jgi:hypothetical protein